MELDPAALSALLRQRRGELGITQSELARRAGVGVRTVRDLEHGVVRNPRTASVRQLLAALTEATSEPMAPALWIGVLGPLIVGRDGTRLALGDTREATVLGLLALTVNQPLSLASAAAAVWADQPPTSATELLNRYVRRLRRLLGPRLRLTVGRGFYRLDLDPEQLDLLQFGELAVQARTAAEAGDLEIAYETYDRALACWRGPVLSGNERLAWHPWAAVLSRQRLSATLAFADIGCALGRHEQTLTRLEAVRDDEPLHEGLHARLMTALAGNGQQAAALELYDNLTERLSAELGIEPGPEIRTAQLRVLRQEIPAAGRGSLGGLNFLPRDMDDFVGRAAEIDDLAQALWKATGPGVHVLSGMAGIGKTTLAVHLGHRLADRFPDGRLFVDLHTHSGTHAPLTVQAALDALLRQLGVDGHRIPDQVDQCAALWRSLLVGREALVVLDDVADAAHVRPLLPGGGTNCQFLITSRSRLTSLDAIDTVPLEVLSDREAVDLFVQVAGTPRICGQDDQVYEVIRLCGFLPLAIRIAAARLRDRPSWTLGHLLALLRNERRRLPALSVGDRSVSAALTLSYRHLNYAQQRLFRLLGDFPGTDFTAAAAAAINNSTAEETTLLLQSLVDVHLLDEVTLDRYSFHDLIRDHARQMGQTEPAGQRYEATARTYVFYIHLAAMAADLLEPTRKRFPITSPPPDHLPALHSTMDALTWFESERLNLAAVVAAAATRGHHVQSWQLAQTLWRYFFIRGHMHLLIETHRIALASTLYLGDTAAEAEIRKSLGLGYWRLGRLDDAIDKHTRALALDRANRDTWGQAKTHNHLGFIHARDGDHAAALKHHQRSAELYEDSGDRCGMARALIGLGDLDYQAGRSSQAATRFRQALELAREVGDRWGEGLASIGVGLTTSLPHARQHLEHALRLTRTTGDRWSEAIALTGLGMVLANANAVDDAINHYRQAINLTQEVGDQWWEQIATAGLTQLREQLGRCAPIQNQVNTSHHTTKHGLYGLPNTST
ncbi:BTAD domain-containing putative transcriptional regulator [Nocardia sp. NPDC057030]|uniref:BTAD domain-containing putative transcriptional regulator n=1 Tax=unclassified Nocardia TaxID=2637762 RepID=UPI0036382BAC